MKVFMASANTISSLTNINDKDLFYHFASVPNQSKLSEVDLKVGKKQ